MNKLLLASTLIGFSQLATAHEGHGVDPHSFFHYLSGSHLGAVAVVLLVAAIGYLAFGRRRQR
ncbi:MAG: hypothetical protein ACI9UU_001048 [Candidatus Azotimanducaceae bacterium]|jgi:hypothetical protein